MTRTSERVGVACPACSPALETAHEVLAPGGQATVRCTRCGHVHKTAVPERETVERDVIVSQDGESVSDTVEAPADETVAVGEEFVLETDEAIMTVRITSLEVGTEQRAEEAPVREVETFWTRAVGNVGVNATIHPADGARDRTRSTKLYVPGDFEFTVGESAEVGNEALSVETIVVREDASGYDFAKLDHAGDAALAKDVKRLYARDESTDAWSAW